MAQIKTQNSPAMDPKAILIVIWIVVQKNCRSEQAIGVYEGFPNTFLNPRFYQESMNAQNATSIFHCAGLCNIQPDCQAFYLDPICHLLINPYKLHKAFLQTSGNKTYYLVTDNLDKLSCKIKKGDMKYGTVEVYKPILTFEECWAKCTKMNGKHIFAHELQKGFEKSQLFYTYRLITDCQAVKYTTLYKDCEIKKSLLPPKWSDPYWGVITGFRNCTEVNMEGLFNDLFEVQTVL